MTRYIARISDSEGRTLHRTAAFDTREQARVAAFAARPTARICSTAKAALIDGEWTETHGDIRWHRSGDHD